MTLKKSLFLFLAMMLLLSVPMALAETTTEAAVETTEASPEADATGAPQMVNPFPTTQILDMNEQPFDSSVFGEKPFMINIWASWCGPCVHEMPALNELSAEYGDRLTIVGLLGDAATVTEDGKIELKQDELDGARKLYEELGINYPSLIPNELMMVLMYQIQMQYFPTTLFFAADGTPLRMEVGGKDKEGWKAVIDEVLAHVEGTPHVHTEPSAP